MKKLSLYIFLVLMVCNVGVADEKPKISYNSVNENIIKYGWKIKSIKFASAKGFPVEIYTLTKGKWIMKCNLRYIHTMMSTTCYLP